MKIYFLHNGLISFVRKDLAILQAAHDVRPEQNHRRAFRNLGRNLLGVLWCDMIFCWFASIHFFPSVVMARLLGRKVVVVAGGYDVVNFPTINYGNMRCGVKSVLVRLMLRLAHRVISISQSNQREALENGHVDPDNSVMIYHGFDTPDVQLHEKERMVVTVGEVTWSNLKRKGLEDFVRVAAFFPDVPFKLVGKWSDGSYQYLQEIATDNVDIMGFVDNETFAGILKRAKVYLQPSRHEGFGCSVAEAMLHYCIPVVSNAFALPEVVGACGFLAPAGDIDGFRTAVERALHSGPELAEAARERIVQTFPLEFRNERLLAVIAGV